MADSFLDKNTPIPLYYQLKEILREKIETGELKPGDLLPSERELSEKYKISRPTIRQALKELVNEGLLYREKGRGTFVSEPKINYGFIQKLTTFYDDMVEKGYIMRTKVLEKDIKLVTKVIAKKLNIEENEKVIYISRIRYIENEPIVSVVNHIPYKLCPDLINEDLEDKSLYRILAEKYELVAYKARVTLEPIVASEYDSELLNIEEGAPIHLMQNITYTKENIIMDYFESHFRGDKGKVMVELYK
ncbi:MAG: GntR family transcriptional regulator, N-acetylglucosamine utilization regulator [Halanaerobiales bacterium]|nr:GntR family transcriptional regulator, N-acetylglucosamine utilization regulator [Halanaerobiales bacterium]